MPTKEERQKYARAYYLANREKIVEQARAYRAVNPEKIAEYQRAWHAANREQILEQKRAYYAANREKVAEQQRAYRAANGEKIAEQKRARYAANREKILERVRAYAAANPEKGRADSAKRRARKNNVEHDGTWPKWPLHEACEYCGETEDLERDHVYPVALGGAYTIGNYQTLCKPCNSAKGDTPEDELRPNFIEERIRLCRRREKDRARRLEK